MLEIQKDLSFVILLTEFRFTGLRATVSTIQSAFPEADCLCVIPKNSNKEEVKVVKTICPVAEAGTTISSMINTGITKSKHNWNLVVISGNLIKYSPVMKYNRFLESEKDVMYRVVDKIHWRWEDASIHGIMMHKNAMKEIGAFPEDEESLPLCKLLWASKAVEKGYKFKGLVGIKLI